jgi:hypothetical protein
MTDVVTRLVVRGDGSLAVLDQFENKMEAAGKATDRATGAVANYEARMAKARAAMEAGNVISTQTVARRSAEQRAFDGLASSVDKSYGLRIRLEREAERAAVSAANAVNMGYISQEQALSTLVALEQRHAAQVMQAATANDNLANSYRSSAAAADEAAAASMRANAARSRTGGGVNQAHTTNLLFQAQDIAMMTAMGQAPMMLAMQQGMQVGGIFHQIGGGRQIVQALGSAIVGLLNPLNLATIAAIGLGAAGVQWFMSMSSGAEDATTALERHNETLDVTLAGYDKVREAAADALQAALKLPEGSVQSDLGAQRADAANQAVAAMERALQLRQEFEGYANYAEAFDVPDDIIAKLSSVSGVISDITSDSALSRQELDQLHTALTQLSNNTADQNIKAIAGEALVLVDAARQAFAQVDSLDTALRNIPRDVQIRLQVSQEFTSSMSGLGDLYIDPRSRFDMAREEAKNLAEQASATAASYGDLVGVGKEYERVLSSIDAAEAEAGKKSAARGAKAAAKPFNEWENATDNFQQRIQQQQMEIGLIGQSTYEIERQRAAFDLLNQAKAAGIPITSELTAQINSMSAEYAAGAVEVERMQAMQVKTFDVSLQLASSFQGIGSSILDVARNAKSASDFLGGMFDMLLDKVAQFASSWLDNIVNNGINSFLGMLGGGVGGGNWNIPSGFVPGGFFPGFASGTNSAPGGLSWVGERGPELVNLPRGAQVFNHQQSMGMAANQNRPISVQTNIINNAGVEVVERSSDDGQGGVRQEIVLNRAVANAIGKPGPAQRAVRQTGRLVTR